MPEMSGKECVQELVNINPKVSVQWFPIRWNLCPRCSITCTLERSIVMASD
jgi:hypothetical protein